MKAVTIAKISLTLALLMSLPSNARDCTKLLESQISGYKLVNTPAGNNKASEIESLRLSKTDCEVYDSLALNKQSKKALEYADKVLQKKPGMDK